MCLSYEKNSITKVEERAGSSGAYDKGFGTSHMRSSGLSGRAFTSGLRELVRSGTYELALIKGLTPSGSVNED